jgi:serine/threonine protein kinase
VTGQAQQIGVRDHALFPGISIDSSVPSRRGGMGIVSKGYQTSLNRPVAVKVLHDDLPQEYLAHEATSAALIDHPNIVRIYESHPEHQPPYFVMAWVEGKPLHEVFWNTSEVDFRSAAQAMRETALALAVVHEQGLVHGDIKPSNVMLAPSGKPYITDFGLSIKRRSNRAAEGALPDSPTPTDGPAVPAPVPAGTEPYIAPELYTPGAFPTPQADVYALGVTFYSILLGHDPFRGTDDPSPTEAFLAGRYKLPRSVREEVPEPLQRICLKAMERDQALRYPSARAMAADLDDYLRGREVLARPSRYHTELGGRITNHIADLEQWHADRFIDLRTKDNLRQAYEDVLHRSSPWHDLAGKAPWETAFLRLGTTLLLLGCVSSITVYWDRLGHAGHILSMAGPAAAVNLAAFLLYRQGQSGKPSLVSLVMFATGAILLAAFVTVALNETSLLRFAAQESAEILGAEAAAGNAPSNWHFLLATSVLVVYLFWLLRRLRHRFIASSTAISLFPAFGSLLLVSGYLDYFDRAKSLAMAAWLIPIAVCASISAWAIRREWQHGSSAFYEVIHLPVLVVLSSLAWFISADYFGAVDAFAPAYHLWLTVNACVYAIIAWLSHRSRVPDLRRWSDFYAVAAAVSVLFSSQMLFDRGPVLLARLGDEPLRLGEPAAFVVAAILVAVGIYLRIRWMWTLADYTLRFCFWRITYRHFVKEDSWSLWVIVFGVLIMGGPLVRMFLRSSKNPVSLGRRTGVSSA